MIRRPNQDNVRKFLTYDSGQLERLLNEMATIIDTRTKKLDLLVETSNKDYVGMILGSNTADTDNANKVLSDVKLSCGNIVDDLSSINTRQPSLLTEIVQENTIFKEKSTNDACVVERNAIIIEMESMITKYNNLHSLLSISNGTTLSLYNKCVQLLQSLTERISQQSFRRQEFEMNIIHGVSSVATAPYPITSMNSFTGDISALDLNRAGSPRNLNNSSINVPTIETKANRLSEMGFNRHDCIQALVANNEDEEMALNSLLAGSPNDLNTNNKISAPPIPPKPSMFSWGSSKK